MKNSYIAPEFELLSALDDKYCADVNSSAKEPNGFGADSIVVKDSL